MQKSIRLLSLNVSIFDENNKKLSRFLKEINADILCLQEVTRKVDSSAYDKYITKEPVDKSNLDLLHSFYAPNWALKDFYRNDFHGKKVFSHDFGGVIEYGNYVKSRYVITEGRSIFVQSHFGLLINWDHVVNNPKETPRTAQVVDILLSDKTNIRIINYHGIWSREKKDSEATISASKKIIDLAKNKSLPTIICGDFNLFPHTKSITMFNNKYRNMVNEYKIKTTRPSSNELSHYERNVVDYIFVSDDIKVHNFQVINSDVSDHFPLVLDFSFN